MVTFLRNFIELFSHHNFPHFMLIEAHGNKFFPVHPPTRPVLASQASFVPTLQTFSITSSFQNFKIFAQETSLPLPLPLPLPFCLLLTLLAQPKKKATKKPKKPKKELGFFRFSAPIFVLHFYLAVWLRRLVAVVCPFGPLMYVWNSDWC